MEGHPYTNEDDYKRQKEELKSQGWVRREFGPGADPWFCSQRCAYDSYRAKNAEKEWNKIKANEIRRMAIFRISASIALIGGLLLTIFWLAK